MLIASPAALTVLCALSNCGWAWPPNMRKEIDCAIEACRAVLVTAVGQKG